MNQKVILDVVIQNPGISTLGIYEKLKEKYGDRFDERQCRAVANRLSYMKSRNYVVNRGGRGEHARWYWN